MTGSVCDFWVAAICRVSAFKVYKPHATRPTLPMGPPEVGTQDGRLGHPSAARDVPSNFKFAPAAGFGANGSGGYAMMSMSTSPAAGWGSMLASSAGSSMAGTPPTGWKERVLQKVQTGAQLSGAKFAQ